MSDAKFINATSFSDSSNETAAKLQLEVMKQLARALLVEVQVFEAVQNLEVGHGVNFYEEVRRFEITLIERALAQTDWHQRRAAQLLNIKATTLHTKMKLYNILSHGTNEAGTDEAAEAIEAGTVASSKSRAADYLQVKEVA